MTDNTVSLHDYLVNYYKLHEGGNKYSVTTMDIKEALKDAEMKIFKAIWEAPKGTEITVKEFKIKHKDLFDEVERLKQMLKEE